MDLGKVLPLWSTVPFVGMLLSIALLPLFAPRFWHHHFGKVAAFWAIAIALPSLVIYRDVALHEFLHIIIADYIPFIIILGALYTVSGGILLKGTLRGTPIVNTGIIAIGTLLASWMGTTGASMLLIRPFLRANSYRENRAFMVVFFIFLVSNIGGSLTPLGDPPLFLGFLRGVPFFWTFKLFPQMLFAAALLLTIYFFIDSYYFKKEGHTGAPQDGIKEPLRVEGIHNLLYLTGIVGAVLLSGFLKLGDLHVFGLHLKIQDILRDVILLFIAGFSMLTTSREIREENEFTWFPMREVAILFIGIFITMMPCLKILAAGIEGELAFLVEGVRDPMHFFWVTGMLSGLLDNAPTYLTFLSTLLGRFYPGVDTHEAISMLIRDNVLYLKAVSAGAVFFGANTYIGNAPNFMVRSIAEETGTRMPSFFGYVFKYSLPILVPVFILITIIFYL